MRITNACVKERIAGLKAEYERLSGIPYDSFTGIVQVPAGRVDAAAYYGAIRELEWLVLTNKSRLKTTGGS